MKASATEGLGCYKLKSYCLMKCSKLLDQRKQGKLQWLQNPSQTNGENLKSVKCGMSRTFKNKKGNI
jgi:hypothetical protein